MRKQKVPELIEFVHAKYERRGKNTIGVGPHIGCVLARRVRTRDDKGRFMSAIGIGWSKVNTVTKDYKNVEVPYYDTKAKKLKKRTALSLTTDSFDKKKAIKLARERAILGNTPPIPKQIASVHERMEDRASRYFKFMSWY